MHRDQVKEWVGLVAVASCFVAYVIASGNERRQKQAQDGARCAASEECTKRKVEKEARRMSLSSKEVVHAETGSAYFRGIPCSSDCESLHNGYAFAERVGLTKPEGCENKDADFVAGCELYYEQLEDSRYEETDPGPR